MKNQLGPLEISCDAPPYSIVQACSQVGIQSPEDVRWCRLRNHLQALAGWPEFLKSFPWKMFIRSGSSTENLCSCGHALPRLEGYKFMLITGKEVSYLIGQCSRCRTVYWEDA
jgi:hypothetical protein